MKTLCVPTLPHQLSQPLSQSQLESDGGTVGMKEAPT